jgi:hypothetical protein
MIRITALNGNKTSALKNETGIKHKNKYCSMMEEREHGYGSINSYLQQWAHTQQRNCQKMNTNKETMGTVFFYDT